MAVKLIILYCKNIEYIDIVQLPKQLHILNIETCNNFKMFTNYQNIIHDNSTLNEKKSHKIKAKLIKKEKNNDNS